MTIDELDLLFVLIDEKSFSAFMVCCYQSPALWGAIDYLNGLLIPHPFLPDHNHNPAPQPNLAALAS